MNILLAVDGSDYSMSAADMIANRPWPPGSAVKILSVVRLPFTPTAETRSLPDSGYSRLEGAAMGHAKEAVDEALARIIPSNANRETPLAITSDILLGQQQETILAQAEEWGADLIVLGSRGLGGFKRFLLGSISSAVATHADCSVQVTRFDEKRPVKKSHMKILVAVDGSAHSDAAVNQVAGRPWPANSEVKIISAVESLQSLRPGSWGLSPDSHQKLENALAEQARAAVEKAAARFRQTTWQTVTVLSEIIPGRARDVILDEADNWGADLIVLGSRGLGGVQRLLLGSVSSAALTLANCSVEIARQRRAA